MDVSPYNPEDLDLCCNKGVGDRSSRGTERSQPIFRNADLSMTHTTAFLLLLLPSLSFSLPSPSLSSPMTFFHEQPPNGPRSCTGYTLNTFRGQANAWLKHTTNQGKSLSLTPVSVTASFRDLWIGLGQDTRPRAILRKDPISLSCL